MRSCLHFEVYIDNRGMLSNRCVLDTLCSPPRHRVQRMAIEATEADFTSLVSLSGSALGRPENVIPATHAPRRRSAQLPSRLCCSCHVIAAITDGLESVSLRSTERSGARTGCGVASYGRDMVIVIIMMNILSTSFVNESQAPQGRKPIEACCLWARLYGQLIPYYLS